MAESGGKAPMRYRAFISYSHADQAAAIDLHVKLERYVLPSAVRAVGGGLSYGRQPLRPIFRDEAELVPGQDLPGRIRDALEGSQYLVVVCSPNAARSEWVAREIEDFIALGRREFILSVVIEGEPNATERGLDPSLECMPEPLRRPLPAAAPAMAAGHNEQLWVDWRGDKRDDRVMFLRVVAALLSLRSLDELIRRDERDRRRRTQIRWMAAAAALIIVACISAFYLLGLRDEAIRRSGTLATLAEAALAESDPERAGRYALLGMAGFDRPLIGFDPREAESALLRATLGSRRDGAPTPLPEAGPGRWGMIASTGRTVLRMSDDGEVQTFDMETGVALGQLLKVDPDALSLDVSPDRQLLAVATSSAAGYVLSLIELASGLVVADGMVGSAHEAPTMVFSPDGGQLAVISGFHDGGGAIDLWDLQTRSRREFASSYQLPYKVAFSADGRYIASSGAGGVQLWDRTSLAAIGPSIAEGDTGGNAGFAVAFSPDSRMLLIGSTSGNVTLHPLDGSQAGAAEAGMSVVGVEFSPDGHAVAALRDDGSTAIWEVEPFTGSLYFGERTIIPRSEDFAFAADGKSLLSARVDRIDRWRLTPAQRNRLFWLPGTIADEIADVAVAGNGREVAAAVRGQSGLRIVTYRLGWAPAPTANYALAQDTATSGSAEIDISADGRRIVSVSAAGAWLIDRADGRATRLLDALSEAYSVCFSPDGTLVATAARGRDDDGTGQDIAFWDAASGAQIGGTVHIDGLAITMRFSPDNATLGISQLEPKPVFIDVTSRLAMEPPFDELASTFAFSPDGKTIAAFTHPTVEFFDRSSGAKTGVPAPMSAGIGVGLGYAPDGGCSRPPASTMSNCGISAGPCRRDRRFSYSAASTTTALRMAAGC